MVASNGTKERPVPFAERAFAVVVMLYGSSALVRVFLGPDGYGAVSDESLASPTKRVLWLSMYLIAGYFLVKRCDSLGQVLKGTTILNVLLVYVAISTLWSETRAISMISVAALVGNSLIGFYFGVRYSLNQFLRVLGWFSGLAVIATLVSPFLTGNYALETGEWTGFFGHKNALGLNMSIGALVFFALARTAKNRKWLYWSFCGVCVMLVLLAQAMTCVVVLFVLASAMICWSLVRRWTSNFARVLFVCLIVTCAALFVTARSDEIFTILGKSPDLTGRLELWGVLGWMAQARPLLGYGYGGFWVFGGPAETVWSTLQRDPEDAIHGHNGYLQLVIDGGMVGLFLLLWLLSVALRKAWSYRRTTKDIWPFSLFLFLSLYNLGDTTFAARNNIAWLLFVAVLVQLVRVAGIESAGKLHLGTNYPAPAPASS